MLIKEKNNTIDKIKNLFIFYFFVTIFAIIIKANVMGQNIVKIKAIIAEKIVDSIKPSLFLVNSPSKKRNIPANVAHKNAI